MGGGSSKSETKQSQIIKYHPTSIPSVYNHLITEIKSKENQKKINVFKDAVKRLSGLEKAFKANEEELGYK